MEKTKWVSDPAHSELGFRIRHLMISNVYGRFQNFSVEAETDGNDFQDASVKVTAQMDSISTNQEQRDAHLRTSDFFEVEQHPEMVFESTKIEKDGEDGFVVDGHLTIKGIQKPVRLKAELNGMVKDPSGNEKAGFLVSGKINRTDWGINFNSALEAGGVLLGDEVRIQSDIQLVKQ